jgi:hypothetical protein
LHENGQKLLNLMFRPGEDVCVSHNKYGYHSIHLKSAFKDEVELIPTDPERKHEKVSTDSLLLVALNPIQGYRQDENCKAYRNFLVEIDGQELKAQIDYIKAIKMPYSAIIFSGNKSMHFLISLDQDLQNEKTYRIISEWILRSVTWADQKTKNPSRSIRIPGAMRKEGRQRLIEFKGPVSLSDLTAWLKTHPEARPKGRVKKVPTEDMDYSRVKKWARDRLRHGLDPHKGRNQQWYAIAYEFALSGYSEDDTIKFLDRFFNPDRDFKEREWLTTIRSAFKHAHGEK